jgi:hypothetical protein
MYLSDGERHPQEASTVTNRYPGTCRKCGQEVQPNEGTCEKVGGKWVVEHSECPAPEVATQTTVAATTTIREGEGYGGHAYKPGQVLHHEGGWWVVVTSSKRYYREDGMSMGVGDERGYVYSTTIRPATDDEAAPMIAATAATEAKAEVKRDAETRRSQIAIRITARGTRPAGMQLADGETYSDRRTIYGGGDWFVIGPEYIWYVKNNGADGDSWCLNNVITGGAGAIGTRVPYDEEIAAEIKGLE